MPQSAQAACLRIERGNLARSLSAQPEKNDARQDNIEEVSRREKCADGKSTNDPTKTISIHAR